MKIHGYYGVAVFIFLVFYTASSAFAQIELQAPERAARGDAFVASARTDEPVKSFVFFWNGGKVVARAEKDASGASVAKALLPVPLDEKASRLALSVGVSSNGDSRPLAQVNTAIALYDKKRPMQKLNVDRKFVSPPASERERIKADREKVRKALASELPERLWDLPMQRPVPGGVSSLFGMRRVFNGNTKSVHRGLDLRGAAGTPIRACADGEVVLVDNLYYSGNTIYLNHGEGVFSAYMHMSEPKAHVGQRVSRGDIIGLVGATGRVTGPHLHLSMIAQGHAIDPQPLLEKPANQAPGKKQKVGG